MATDRRKTDHAQLSTRATTRRRFASPWWRVGIRTGTVERRNARLEDFAYGIPAQFGFSVAPAAALAGLAYTGHTILVALAIASFTAWRSRRRV